MQNSDLPDARTVVPGHAVTYHNQPVAPREVHGFRSERRAPRFVTARADLAGAERTTDTWSGLAVGTPLTGYEFDSALVVCTHADLADKRFREWLRVDLATRFAPGARGIRLELLST